MRPFISIILFVFFIVSCTTTAPRGKQAWSKKPYFASLMIDDVHYTLSSIDNKYSLNKPVDFRLTLKNLSDSKKEFKKRYGKSPDKADAMILTFYQGGSMIMSDSARSGMASRRKR